MVKLEQETVKAAEKALQSGFKVELYVDKAGQVVAQSVKRKRLEVNRAPKA